MKQRIATCYIAAPPGAKLATIREALSKRGIRVLVPDLSPMGSVHTVAPTISKADLVIGVLTPQRRSQWVLFELGQAAALNKRIVIIAPPKSDVFSDIHGLLVLRISLSNRAAIEFALDQVLAAPDRVGSAVIPHPTEGRGIGAIADQLSDQLKDTLDNRDGRKFEELVATAIRASGVEIVAEAPRNDSRFDLAIWSDALHPFVGNPLLIEAKLQLISALELKAALQQCARSAHAYGSAWSLLIYGKGPERRDDAWAAGAPTVLLISFSELIGAMRHRSFVEVVRDLRNVRVHGGAREASD